MDARQAVLIIGIGRSGTSAVMGIVSGLGLDVGRALIPADAANPRGYFENPTLVQLNSQILANYGGSFLDPPNLPTNWLAHQNSKLAKKQIQKVIRRDYPGIRIAIKDPRLSMVAPLYFAALTELGYDVRCLFVIRDRDRLARAWSRLSGGAVCEADFLPRFKRYDDHIAGFQKPDDLVVDFGRLLADPISVATDIAGYLGLQPTEDQFQQAADAIDPSISKNSGRPG